MKFDLYCSSVLESNVLERSVSLWDVIYFKCNMPGVIARRAKTVQALPACCANCVRAGCCSLPARARGVGCPMFVTRDVQQVENDVGRE